MQVYNYFWFISWTSQVFWRITNVKVLENFDVNFVIAKSTFEENFRHINKLFFRTPKNGRSSHQRCFIEIGVLKNFTKFTGKHLRQSFFFNNFIKKETLAEACNFIKKETLAHVFSCEFCEIFKNTFLPNTSGRLLLEWLLLTIVSTISKVEQVRDYGKLVILKEIPERETAKCMRWKITQV